MTEPLDAELLKDLRGVGKPPSFDGNDAEYQEFSLQLPNPHEPHQCGLSHVNGQVRNRGKLDLPGSSGITGQCTPEVLQTDVLFVGLDVHGPSPHASWVVHQLSRQFCRVSLALFPFGSRVVIHLLLLSVPSCQF